MKSPISSSPKSVFDEIEMVDPYNSYLRDFLVKAEHLARYLWAARFLRKHFNGQAVVFDLGCGSGYGTRILSESAKKAIGFDYNQEFLNIAHSTYLCDRTRFHLVDFNTLEGLRFHSLVGGERPDVAVCFEAIEHLIHPDKFLSRVFDALSRDRYFLCSIPNERWEPKKSGKSRNPFHKHLFSFADSVRLLKDAGFQIVDVLGQPWPNVLLHLFPKFHHKFDSLFLASHARLRFGSKLLGWPIHVLKEKSYSYIFICRK